MKNSFLPREFERILENLNGGVSYHYIIDRRNYTKLLFVLIMASVEAKHVNSLLKAFITVFVVFI